MATYQIECHVKWGLNKRDRCTWFVGKGGGGSRSTKEERWNFGWPSWSRWWCPWFGMKLNDWHSNEDKCPSNWWNEPLDFDIVLLNHGYIQTLSMLTFTCALIIFVNTLYLLKRILSIMNTWFVSVLNGYALFLALPHNWMTDRMNANLNAWMNAWMNEWKDALRNCMNEYINEGMNECIQWLNEFMPECLWNAQMSV